MTRPDLAAKAREIAAAHTEPFTAVVTDRKRTIGYVGFSPGSPRMTKDTLEAAILVALTEADAAATERAAKVAEAWAASLRRAAHAMRARATDDRYALACALNASSLEGDAAKALALAAAIRNQEKPDV